MRKHRRVLLTAPTGSGKGVLISFMMKEAAARGLRSWLVCHRRELLDQLSAGLHEVGVPHGIIAAGRDGSTAPIQIASVATLTRRLDKLQPPALLVLDEAHHAVARTWRRIMEHCAKSWVVGLTATPVRTSGEGLDDLFDALVLGPTVPELIQAGHLSRYRLIGPPAPLDLSGVRVRHGDYVTAELEEAVDKNAVVGDAVEHYRKYVAPQSCLAFCVSRKHARHVEEAYRAAGINARYVGGDTPADERQQAVRDFKSGKLPVITSVEIFSEGVDSPGLRAVQLLRPTRSLGLFLQQVGRGLRVEPGKRECVVLDHCGLSYRFGLVADIRSWTLAGRVKKAKDEPIPQLRHCEKCFAIFGGWASVCPACGAVLPVQSRMPEQKEGELAELDVEMIRRARAREEGKAHGLEALVRLALERGYKVAWAGVRHAIRTGMDRRQAIKEAQDFARSLPSQ